MAESRVRKSLLNARVNLMFYFLLLILSFFSRRIFLNTLGADFLGLTGTLSNLLGFLNLAELGVGSAIGYVLYGPLFDRDKNKITEIISVLSFLYRRIGLMILGIGCLFSCFLPFIFPSTDFSFSLIYFAYFSFLTSSLIGYFANYKQTLLGADQRNYVVTAYFQTSVIIKTLIQIGCAYYYKNYYLWVAIELLFGIIYSVVLNWKINRVYPWLKSSVKKGKEEYGNYKIIIVKAKQMFVHQISGFVQFQTVPLLIYLFVSLQTVAFYGNYTLITDKVINLFNNFLGSVGAGVGNLIAEDNRSKIKKVFKELTSIRFFCSGIICTALYFFMQSFIRLWLGEEYLLSHSTLVIIILNFFVLFVCGKPSMQFLYGYGLFQDTWAPIAKLCLNLSVSIIGGFFVGLDGILFGNLISVLLIDGVWKPIFLFRKGFKEPVLPFWIDWIKHLIIILLPALLCYYLVSYRYSIVKISSYYDWILSFVFIMSIYTIVLFVLLYFFTFGFRVFVNRFFCIRR